MCNHKSKQLQSRPLNLPYMRSHSQARCVMSIIGWIILGLISGFIASKIVNKTGQGFFLDLVLGIVGAIVGGLIFSALGASGITGLNLYSMVVAVIGAVVVLVVYHMASGRRAF
jgi:uncharacterized membrane protein YeaQ/YmgE (transglycosylase-associated protein family)